MTAPLPVPVRYMIASPAGAWLASSVELRRVHETVRPGESIYRVAFRPESRKARPYLTLVFGLVDLPPAQLSRARASRSFVGRTAA